MAANGPEYWLNEGGQAWLKNIVATEKLIGPLGEYLLAAAAPKCGDIVMDVGCGGGQTTRALAQAVAPDGRVVGVDISPDILEFAKQRSSKHGNLQFILGNAQTDRLAPAEFDLVVSRFGVMFFEDPVAAFSNLRSALKPTGRLVFMCWQPLDENPWMAEPLAAVSEVLAPPPPQDPHAPGPFSLSDADRIRQLLKLAGFSRPVIEGKPHEMKHADIDHALNYIMNMGPVGRLVREADDEEAERARTAVAAVLRRYKTPDGVRMPAMTWLVTATPL